MNKEEYINIMHQKIEACKDTTCYTDDDINIMKSNATKIFNEVFKINDTVLSFIDYKSEEKQVKIQIEKYEFGHNDFKIYCDDFPMKQALKQLFISLKNENKISDFRSNGFGTAFVLSYDSINILI